MIMKKKYYLYSLFATVAISLASCDYNEDNFPGYDELAHPTDIGNDTLTLAANDYKTIAELEANKAIALKQDPEGETALKALEAVGTNKYFTENAPAALYMPAFISSKYPYFDNGSKVTIYYDNYEKLPAYLNELNSATNYELNSDDYSIVWGDNRIVNYLTPSTVTQIPTILKETINNPKEGEVRMVNYAYSETEPATGGGDEIVTYKKINEVLSTGAGTYNVKATVIATYTRGFLLGDETGSILVYLNNVGNYSVGDVVTVSGDVTEYGGTLQFSASANIAFIERSETFAYPQATAMSATEMEAWKEAPEVKYVSITGKLSISNGKYYNIIVDGTELQGSISYPMTGMIDANLDGQQITATGYLIGFSSGKYVNMMATSVVAAGTSNEYTPIGVVALSSAGKYTVKGSVAAIYERGFLLNDGTGSILTYKSGTGVKVGDIVTITGETSSYAGFMQYSNSAEVAIITEGSSFTYPNAYVLDGAAMDAYISNPYVAYVRYEGTLTIDGNYYNVQIDGAGTAIGSISYPGAEMVPAALNGKKVIVTGYSIGVSSNKFFNTMATSVVEATTTTRAALDMTRTTVKSNAAAVYTYNSGSWKAYTTKEAKIAVLQPTDYNQIGYSYINKPAETLPIYLKQTYPYAKVDDVVAVVYIANENGTINATEFKYDGSNWIETIVAQRTSIVFLKSNDSWTEAKVYYESSLLNGESGGFVTQDIALDGLQQIWSLENTYGWKASGYSGSNKNTESWLISPEIDLTKAIAPVIKMDVAINYLKAKTVDDYFSVNISTDYVDDVTTTTWTKVEGIQWPAGDSWTFYTLEGISLNDFVGQKIRIAFRYTSDSETAITAEVKNLSVQE